MLRTVTATRAAGRTPVVVFDLDHTLFDNGPRTWAILAEYLDAKGPKEVRSRLDSLPRFNLPYLLKDILRGPLELADPELERALFDYWVARFFQDAWIDRDVPYDGAVAFVQEVFDAGATVVYLTGRDSPNMLIGTAASLRAHGFPVGVAHTALVLKPKFEIPDAEFKKDAVGFIATLGDVVAFLDNEPANCNVAVRAWPRCHALFMDTVRAPGPLDLDPDVATYARYEDP